MEAVEDRILTLMDTLESMDEVYAATHSDVLLTLFDEDSPSSSEIAAMYLQWVISKQDIVKNSFRKVCTCEAGWVEGDDGGVKPCPRCRSEANERWFAEFVDSAKEPE